jgi:hypothetical protein
MLRMLLAALLAASLGACMGAGDQRPEPTVGGEQQGPANSPDPIRTPQPPDNYP